MADPGGVLPARAPPPQGSRFFRFDIQNFRNVAALGVGAPPTRLAPPPTGNPGSAAGYVHEEIIYISQVVSISTVVQVAFLRITCSYDLVLKHADFS